MPLVSKKCPVCRGCMDYKYIRNEGKAKPYLYCDFCDKLFLRIAGGKLIEKELTDANRYKFGL